MAVLGCSEVAKTTNDSGAGGGGGRSGSGGSGGGGDVPTDGRADLPSDGPTDLPIDGPCPQGGSPYYTRAGCASSTPQPECVTGVDACFQFICSCRGVTIGGCGGAVEPWAFIGSCAEGGVVDTGGDTAVGN